MEMISTSRYRKHYYAWNDSMGFFDSLAQLAYLVITANEPIAHPLMEEKESDSMAVLVIGSDRGLCGSYNANIFRLLNVHISRAKRLKKKLKIYAYGRKVESYLKSHGISIEKVYDDFEEVPSEEQVVSIGEDFCGQYERGEICYFGVVYTRFYSMASQREQTLTVLPLSELIDDLTTRATVIWPWELAFEDFSLSPSAVEIFRSLADMMIRSSILGCFRDAALSEHLARVVAMRSATENSEKMIDELTGEYNRARQSQITGELMDIIGGAEALR